MHTRCLHLAVCSICMQYTAAHISTHWRSVVQLLWGLSRPISVLVPLRLEVGVLQACGAQARTVFLLDFSRCRRRNSELSYNGYYCLSLLAGMSIRGEFLLPPAPVVSVSINYKHSLMKSKHQDTFFLVTSLLSSGQQMLGTQPPHLECRNWN